MTDFVQVRIPAPLRDRIDAVRGTEKREPWVRRALESALSEDEESTGPGEIPVPSPMRGSAAPTRAHATSQGRAHHYTCRCPVCNAAKRVTKPKGSS